MSHAIEGLVSVILFSKEVILVFPIQSFLQWAGREIPHHDFVPSIKALSPTKFPESNSLLFMNNSLLLKIPSIQPPRENPAILQSITGHLFLT